MGILANLRKALPSTGRGKPTEMVGRGGGVLRGGYLDSHETHASLRGSRRYITYSQIIANVGIVASALRHHINLSGAVEWKVKPSADDPVSREYAEKLESTMEDPRTSYRRIVKRGSMYQFYGFSVQEWAIKKRPDGVITFADVEARPQKTITRWERDPKTNHIETIIQEHPENYRELAIPRWKCIYLVDDTMDDTPEGVGLLRHVANDARILQRLEALEQTGFENNLEGVPVAYVPYGLLQELVAAKKLSEAERDAIIKQIRDFINGGHVRSHKTGLMLDSGIYRSRDTAAAPSPAKQFYLEILQGKSEALAHMDNAIMRKLHSIARTLGVEGQLLGETSGNRALAEDKSLNLYLTVDSANADMAEAMNLSWRDTLWTLNGWPEEHKPRFDVDKLKRQDIQTIAAALRDIAAAAPIISPEDAATRELFDIMDLTPPDDITRRLDATLDGRRQTGAPDPDKVGDILEGDQSGGGE